MNKQYLKAAAEAFAGVSKIDSACYHYLDGGYHSEYQLILLAHYLPVMIERGKSTGIDAKYVEPVVLTALTELTYPTSDNNSFAWSGRQRAAFAGIAQKTWSRNKLSEHVEHIITDIRYRSNTTYWRVRENIQGITPYNDVDDIAETS